MGRHSAPDDADEPVGVEESSPALAPDAELAALIAARGRHARGDASGADTAPAADLDQTQRISIISDAPMEPEPTGPIPLAEPVEPKAERETEQGQRESDTRADLRLLRHNPAVRAQAIGAVIATFLVYTLVMIVLGRTTDYLVWLWAPIVAAGVLVGLVLDLAHRRIDKQAGPG